MKIILWLYTWIGFCLLATIYLNAIILFKDTHNWIHLIATLPPTIIYVWVLNYLKKK